MLRTPSGPSLKLLLVATKKDLVTPVNEAAVQAKINDFYQEFPLPSDPQPLFVSAKDANTKSLLIDEMCLRFPVNDSVNMVAQNASILKRLQTIEGKLQNRYFKPDASRGNIDFLILMAFPYRD
jgi:hypothetical protein